MEKKKKLFQEMFLYHVISDKPIHIDFMRIVKGSKIILQIPVIFKNNKDCPGLKSGGVLNIVRRKVELSCSAENIPENIVVDLARFRDWSKYKNIFCKLPENAKPTITDRDFVVATIAAPTIVKEPEKPAEETPTEGVEGDAAPTAEGGEAAAPAKEGELLLKKMKKAKNKLVIKKACSKTCWRKNKKKNKFICFY